MWLSRASAGVVTALLTLPTPLMYMILGSTCVDSFSVGFPTRVSRVSRAVSPSFAPH